MSHPAVSPRRWTFWVIAFIALLWNLIGVAIFVMQVQLTPEMIAAMPAPQRAVYAATPAWINLCSGGRRVGSGCHQLLLKKRWAVPCPGLAAGHRRAVGRRLCRDPGLAGLGCVGTGVAGDAGGDRPVPVVVLARRGGKGLDFLSGLMTDCAIR